MYFNEHREKEELEKRTKSADKNALLLKIKVWRLKSENKDGQDI